MKKVILLLLVSVSMAGTTVAQDAVMMAGTVYKKAFENERVRMLRVKFRPGELTAPHTHPDYLLYVVEGGKIMTSDVEGVATLIELMAGDYLWVPATKHSMKNVGTTTITGIAVELKEPPAADPAK